MPDDVPGERDQLTALHDAAVRLLARGAPELGILEQMADQAGVLAQSTDREVAAAAQLLELRLLAALLFERATLLRRLAHDLQHLARWLPPEQPDQN
jgi:hypothetical protein